MVLSEAELAIGSTQYIVKTRIGSRNVACGIGMWVIGYELSTRCDAREYQSHSS